MVTFSGASAAPVIPVMTPAEDDLVAGSALEFVGYGVTEFDNNNTVRYHVDGEVNDVDPLVFDYFQNDGGPCSGDSGGPSLSLVGGQERVSGVTSYGGDCWQDGVSGRASAVYNTFIAPYMSGNPPPPGCDQCAQDAQQGGACSNAVQQCGNLPACVDLVDCLNDCPAADAACQQACANQAGQAAVDAYTAIIDCICDNACVQECATECGGSSSSSSTSASSSGPSSAASTGAGPGPGAGGGASTGVGVGGAGTSSGGDDDGTTTTAIATTMPTRRAAAPRRPSRRVAHSADWPPASCSSVSPSRAVGAAADRPKATSSPGATARATTPCSALPCARCASHPRCSSRPSPSPRPARRPRNRRPTSRRRTLPRRRLPHGTRRRTRSAPCAAPARAPPSRPRCGC